MNDGSKPFYPLLKNTKTPKHQIKETEEGRSRKVCLGRRLLLATMDNVNNLCWGNKLPTSQPIPWKSPGTFYPFYPLLFHPPLDKGTVPSTLPNATRSISSANKSAYCQPRQVIHWLIYEALYLQPCMNICLPFCGGGQYQLSLSTIIQWVMTYLTGPVQKRNEMKY